MPLDRLVRQVAYWGLDYLEGRPVGRHVQDLENALGDPEAAVRRLDSTFGGFMDYACQTTGYYKQFAGARDLRDVPVLSKRTIQLHHDQFLSTRYAQSSLVCVSTSGSYGTPVTYHLTREKKARQVAEVIYFGRWAGYELGDRHAYLRVLAGRHKSRFTLFTQNEILADPTALSEEWLDRQMRTLLQKSVKVVIGYPSTVAALAAYSEAQGVEPARYRLKAIITMAEPLHEIIRVDVERAFGCPVLSRYSTQEFGVLAQECLAGRRHHVNVASFIVEVLARESDEPVRPREPGRVVVTDLYSHGMPLIRYDTGDLAVYGSDCPCGLPGPTLERVEGRLVEEIYAADGRPISPLAPTGARKDVDGILQYQFAQLADGLYEMRLHVFPSFNGEDIIRRRLVEMLGEGADIRFKYVNAIAPLPSGKRPVVVNEVERG